MVEATQKMTMQEARRLPRKTRTVRKMARRLGPIRGEYPGQLTNHSSPGDHVLVQLLTDDLVRLPVGVPAIAQIKTLLLC